MKRMGFLLLAALLAWPAIAQEQVTFDSEINVPIGATEVLRFPENVEIVKVLSKGVVEAIGITSRQISLTGIAVGSTVLLVYGANDRQIYSARLVVEGDARGHRVNVYSKKDTHEYYAYYCTPTGCRRIKDELEGPPKQSAQETKTTTIYKRSGLYD